MSDPRDRRESAGSNVVLTEQEQRWADRFERGGVEIVHGSCSDSGAGPKSWEEPDNDD